MNLATAGRGLLHEGLAAGLVSADAASMLKALEIFGAALLILDVCILSVWFRKAIRRFGLSGAGSAFDRSERPGARGDHRAQGERSDPAFVAALTTFSPLISPTCRGPSQYEVIIRAYGSENGDRLAAVGCRTGGRRQPCNLSPPGCDRADAIDYATFFGRFSTRVPRVPIPGSIFACKYA